jgi:hypothetical protein
MHTSEKVASWVGSGSAQPKRQLLEWVQEAHNRKDSFVDGFKKLPSQSNKCVCTLEQYFPDVFARGPLFTSKNIRGFSHPSSHKYSVRRLGTQNEKFVSQKLF